MGGVGYQSSAWSIEVRRGCHELPRGSFVVTALQVEPESAAKPRPASFILGRASLTLESAFRLQEPFEFEHQMAADGRQRTAARAYAKGRYRWRLCENSLIGRNLSQDLRVHDHMEVMYAQIH